MESNEILIFLENLFISRWADSKDDLKKVYSSKTFKVEKILKSDKFNIYFKKNFNRDSYPPYTKKKLNLISSIIFLRNIIINKNKKLILPINIENIENIKTEYAYLRVDLLNIIKKKNNYKNEKNLDLDYDNYIQKKADNLEEKFYTIKNELGYECIYYRDLKFIKYKDKQIYYLINNKNQKKIISNQNINLN